MMFSCGVPQESILGPILFPTYISPVTNIIKPFGVNQQQYADNTDLYIELSATILGTTVKILRTVLRLYQLWFTENGLALNPDKSEVV